MNVGIDIRCLGLPEPTGVPEYLTELLRALFEIDKTNQYFLFYNSAKNKAKFLPSFTQPNVHYIVTRWPNKLLNIGLKFFKCPKLDKLIIKLANRSQTTSYQLQTLDIFFSPNPNFNSISTETKHILFIHDLADEFFPQFFTYKHRLWHYLINPQAQTQRADIILTPSQCTKNDVIKNYNLPTNKVRVLLPGLASIFFSKNKTPKQEVKQKYSLPDKYILYFGSIEPRKNVLAVVKAFEAIAPKLSAGYSLVIAGAAGWDNKAVYQAAAKSKYQNLIKFTGYVATKDKPALYKLSSLLVWPSYYEGFGFPILEAMASGVPIVTSNRASLPEITGNTAYLVNPHKIEEIAEGIVQILINPNIKTGQIKNGLVKAALFSWDKTAAQLLNILSDLRNSQ